MVVKTTLGPAEPFTLVTELGVANSIQFDNVLAGNALKTKFLLTSVLIAILPATALDKPNIAA